MQRLKQWFKLLILLFSIIFSWLGAPPIHNHYTYRAIADNPAQTTASRHDIIPLDRKNPPQRFYIRFYYQVDGKEYTTHTTQTDGDGVKRYLAESPVEILYVADNPTIATLKRYFDLNHGKENLWQILVIGILGTLMFALPISLALMPFAWLIRHRHDIRPDLPPPPVKPFLVNTFIVYALIVMALTLTFQFFSVNRDIHHSILPFLVAIFLVGSHMSERHGRFYHNREKVHLASMLLGIFLASQFFQLLIRKWTTGFSIPLPPLDFLLIFYGALSTLYGVVIYTALDGVSLYHARRKR